MLVSSVEPRRIGRTPVARSASTAIRFMSTALVKEMARQCAEKAICNGHNVMVTIPAGPLSSEFRRSSIALLESGAIIRPKNYMGAINSSDGALTVIISHDMVDVLINKHINIAKEKTAARLGRYSKHLSRLLASALPEGAVHGASVSIDNVNSVSAISCKATVTSRSGAKLTADYGIQRDALSMLRRIIAPYNLRNAAVEVSFSADGDGPTYLTLNGMVIHPTKSDEIASITTVPASGKPQVTLRQAAGYPSYR